MLTNWRMLYKSLGPSVCNAMDSSNFSMESYSLSYYLRFFA